MTRLFVDQALVSGQEIELSARAAHHVRTVLRLTRDARVEIFNAAGQVHEAALTVVARGAVRAAVGDRLETDTESPLETTLVQCISRGERMDYTIQKAVELGVSRIVPVISKRTVVKFDRQRECKRLAHWQGIIEHAAEQSGRTRLPTLSAVESLREWAQTHAGGHCFMLHPGNAVPLARQPQPGDSVTLIAGPEGGFAADEADALCARGVVPVSLGPRTLRTETAALCALAVVQAMWGDLA